MNVLSRLWRRARREWEACFVPDRNVIRRHYFQSFGRYPDLDNPKDFSEKIQWLKLNYRPAILAKLADKYEVRGFVEHRVGRSYLNGLIGVWTTADEIDFASLPARFVLKATHGSGMNLICRDRAQVDWRRERSVLARWLKTNYYLPTREWAYKNIRPRIVAEEYIDAGPEGPPDFKVFCFDGKPKLIQVDLNRFSDHRRAVFDACWNPLPVELHYPWPHQPPARPPNLHEMLHIAEALSEGLPFCRVDLYSVGSRVIFGEMTFYPGNGMAHFRPSEWDRRVGDWLALPERAR